METKIWPGQSLYLIFNDRGSTVIWRVIMIILWLGRALPSGGWSRVAIFHISRDIGQLHAPQAHVIFPLSSPVLLLNVGRRSNSKCDHTQQIAWFPALLVVRLLLLLTTCPERMTSAGHGQWCGAGQGVSWGRSYLQVSFLMSLPGPLCGLKCVCVWGIPIYFNRKICLWSMTQDETQSPGIILVGLLLAPPL